MRDLYPRLFEPPFLSPGVPNPRHLDEGEYRAAAIAAAVRGGRRNGVRVRAEDVSFGGSAFGATRVTVRVRGEVRVALGRRGRSGRARLVRIPVRARATAELFPAAGGAFPGQASGGGYGGPLAYRQGEPMRPDVALAFDRMAAAARGEAGLFLAVTSGFRSDAEQARLFAAHPDPKWVAPPGESLHRYATELDLGPPAAYGWLAANGPRFGFVQRYSWEPWHWGYTRGIGSSSVGYGARGGDGAATRAVQSFVPARYAPPIVHAAQRWSVSAQLLAAQLYAESGFNPFARSPAGAAGHRPVHARHGRRGRSRRPVRPRLRHQRPGAPDARPARPLRRGAAGARGLQRRPRRGVRMRLRTADPRDDRLRRPHPRPAGRRRRSDVGALEVRLVR